jgi:predicted alpha/beta hydrolase family esterase
MRISDLDLLIIPGLGGSGPDHWQHRWGQKLSTARIVEQDDWRAPARDVWVARILSEIDASERPVALIGHSLGALAAADALAQRQLAQRRSGQPQEEKVKAVFFAAPPDLESPGLAGQVIDPAFKEKAPQAALRVPGVLIASRSDPFAAWAYAERLADVWALDLADAGDAGHLNAESGHGPWPEGLMRLAGLFAKI